MDNDRVQSPVQMIEARFEHLVTERAGELPAFEREFEDLTLRSTNRDRQEAALCISEQDEGHSRGAILLLRIDSHDLDRQEIALLVVDGLHK